MATRALPSVSVPLLTMAMPTAYARLAYLPYASHALQAKPASAHPISKAVKQSTCTTSVRVYSAGAPESKTTQSEPNRTILCWC